MRFFVDKSNPTPLQTQLKEQIKILLLMGRLREGDILPSIRELEEQLGIGRSIIWAAYRDLERVGILKLKRGRGVLVNRGYENSRENQAQIHRCERLSNKFIREIQRNGFVLSSFVRYLSNRVMEVEAKQSPFGVVEDSHTLSEDYARQISKCWNVRTVSILLDDLIRDDAILTRVNKLITSYYCFDMVKKIAQSREVPVFPVSADWSQEMLDELKALPEGSKVLLLFRKEDQLRYGELFINDLRETLSDWALEFSSASMGSEEELKDLVSSGTYQRIYVGNRIWDSLSEELKRLPTVSHPTLTINRDDLEDIRVKAGVIV